MLSRRLCGVLCAAMLGLAGLSPARADDKPITIGFGMALTGGLATNGKAALLSMRIWEVEVNAKGRLLGRSVKMVVYDDQSEPSGSADQAAGLNCEKRRPPGRGSSDDRKQATSRSELIQALGRENGR